MFVLVHAAPRRVLVISCLAFGLFLAGGCGGPEDTAAPAPGSEAVGSQLQELSTNTEGEASTQLQSESSYACPAEPATWGRCARGEVGDVRHIVDKRCDAQVCQILPTKKCYWLYAHLDYRCDGSYWRKLVGCICKN